jgi:hypothetical protein
MGATQNQIVNANAIFAFDGYVVQIGADEGSLTSVGSCDGDITGVINYTRSLIQNSGGQDILGQMKNFTADLSFVLQEFNVDKINEIGSGLFEQADIAGTPVVGANQTVNNGNWELDKLIELSGQNASGAQPTINSVTGSVDGALILDDDYFVTQTKAGKWAIYVVNTGTATATQAQNITINTDYTPAEAKRLFAGAATVELVPQVVRFINTDENGKVRQLTIYRADLGDGGFTFSFGSALNEGVNTYPITMQGRLDSSRTNGRQLLEYLDEQQV